MFKIFKNRVGSFVFTVFILFFIQTVEGNASFVKNRFQEWETASTLEKSVIIEVGDRAVIHDLEEKKGFALRKVEKVAMFSASAFWGGIGIVSLLSALCVGDIFSAVVSLLGLFYTL
ncbi:hypothetical protein GGR08_001104 [Bartonella fuyuanensis]|uniref:Uncharacterized protein n=1 Tax=Bartonella fuyuanensis TaxID=1460968 RepID=A0A840DZ56_9HYPH|nr:hypothetical protein [Bartonella fuyuanensis]MBB4076795.1 hypothetical protein [Bartonella fuyuanensis]